MDAKMTVVESIVLDSMDAIMGSFAGISEVITQITETTVPLAQSLSEATIEFEKFAGVNKELAAGIIETGMGFGFTAEESLAAGAKMAQLTALIGESSVGAATEMGQTFALISGMGTTEAMTRMINMHQQTGFMYGHLTKAQFDLMTAEQQANHVRVNTIEILDQLNTVENRSAASMKQITFVMNQFASQAHQTGESIAHMAAMSAVLIESGEEQGKAGRALRMIYARLGADTSGASTELNKLGIETHTASGALRPLSSIVEDLSSKFSTLSDEERQRIVQTVAGNDHYVRFIKLIQNQERMSELATDAIVDQATASEELNRVLEDQSTALKEAQAEMQHNQALLGQALVPAYTRATEIQAQFTLGLAQLSETGFGNAVATGLITLQRYAQILGGVFDMYLNMKSVNIAMRTHTAILRAINGEELVRTDTHRQRNTLATATIANDEIIAGLQEKILLAKLRITEYDNIYGHNSQMRVRLEQQLAYETERVGVLIAERNTLHQTEMQSRTKMSMLALELESIETNAYVNTIQRTKVQGMAQAHLGQQQIANMIAVNAQLEVELVATGRRIQEGKILINQELHKHAIELAKIEAQDTQLMNAKIELEQARKMGLMAANHVDLEEEVNRQLQENMVRRAGIIRLTELHDGYNSILISQDKERNKAAATMLSRNEALLDVNYMLVQLTETEASRKSRIAAIDEELVMTLRAQGILKEQLGFLTQEEIATLPVLIGQKAQLTEAEKAQNMAEIQRIIARRQLNAEGLRTLPLLSAQSQALTKFSMAAGMASMSVQVLAGVFGFDEERSMRVSMMLMTLSMIPAMAQMAQMTVGMTSAGLAAQGAATATNKFNMALKGIGIGIAIAGVVYLFDIITGMGKKASDEVDELNDSLMLTDKLLSDMTHEEATSLGVPTTLVDTLGSTIDLTTMNVTELRNAISSAESEIDNIDTKVSELGSDHPGIPTLLDEKGELEKMIGSLDQALALEISLQYQGLDVNSTFARKKVLRDLEAGLFSGDGAPDNFARTLVPGIEYVPLDTATGTEYIEIDTMVHAYKDLDETIAGLADGSIRYNEINEEGLAFLSALAESGSYLADNFGYAAEVIVEDTEEIGSTFTEAEEKMRAFANAREELFFGGKSQYMSGEMMKQVVNKGVENLYSNVELLMTNNFYGLTFDEAVNEISNRITDQLISQGVPLNSS